MQLSREEQLELKRPIREAEKADFVDRYKDALRTTISECSAALAAAIETANGEGYIATLAAKEEEKAALIEGYKKEKFISAYTKEDFGDGRFFFNGLNGTKYPDTEIKRVFFGPTPDFLYAEVIYVRAFNEPFANTQAARDFIKTIEKDAVLKVNNQTRFYLPIIGFFKPAKYKKFNNKAQTIKG